MNRMWLYGLVAWPKRRWITATAFTPATGALFWFVNGGRGSPLVLAAVAVSAILGALVLASYVSAVGRLRPDAGCVPCAYSSLAMAGMSALAFAAGPGDLWMALVAVLMLVTALARRVRGEASCAMPAPDPLARTGRVSAQPSGRRETAVTAATHD